MVIMMLQVALYNIYLIRLLDLSLCSDMSPSSDMSPGHTLLSLWPTSRNLSGRSGGDLRISDSGKQEPYLCVCMMQIFTVCSSIQHTQQFVKKLF